MPLFALALGLSGAFAGQAPAAPGTAPADDPVASWVRAADSLHPDARAAEADVRAAREQIRSSRAWMPPNAQVQYKSDGTTELSLSQMLPAPGKTARQEAVAGSRLDMARADSSDRARKRELAVREAAWMEWMAWRKAEVLADRESLAVRAAAATRRLQAQGMASAAEAWLAEARIRQVRLEAERARAEAEAATAMREAWTGPGPRLEAGPAVPPDESDSALFEAASRRPDIQAMGREADMQEAMGASMRAGLRPDLMVGAMAMRMPDGMPGWGVMAGLSLPFAPWSRGMAEGEAASARARSRAAQAKAQAMARMARSEVVDHAARLRAAWRALSELDTLLPTQERAVADARARYAQGREMATMIPAMEEMVAMTRMESVMRRGEYELERARLHAAAGLSPTSRTVGTEASARAASSEVTP